jgi:hypothetical protein
MPALTYGMPHQEEPEEGVRRPTESDITNSAKVYIHTLFGPLPEPELNFIVYEMVKDTRRYQRFLDKPDAGDA